MTDRLSDTHAEGFDLNALRRTRRPSGRARVLTIVGPAVYIVVVWYVGARKISDQFVAAHLPTIILAAAVFLLATWLRAWKWRYVLGGGQGAYAVYFLSKVAANWAPGRLGEFSPLALRRWRNARIGAWILLDRVIEVYVMLAIGLIGLGFIDLIPFNAYLAAVVVTTTACIAGGYLLTRREFFHRLAQRGGDDREPLADTRSNREPLADAHGSEGSGGRARMRAWNRKLMSILANVSAEIHGFGRMIPVVVVTTVVAKCGDMWAVCLLFRGMGYDVSFALASAAKCALAVISYVPVTPVASGIPHGAQAWIMNRAAGVPYDALVAAISMEIVVVSATLLSSFGLALYFSGLFPSKRAAEQPPEKLSQ